jgi:hypothetical protein
MALTPGIYTGLAAEEYHADPCPEPSLSASIAQVLLAQSPAHARTQHPRLNPLFVREDEARFDLGTAVHAFLLEGATRFTVVAATDWRTKAAQEQRARIRAEGKIPLLAEQAGRVEEMAAAARDQLSFYSPRPFAAGDPEVTLVWQEPNGIRCRARLDWLTPDRRWIWDYKSTEGSAHPEAWTRGPLFSLGYDVQAAFYRRGVQVLTGIEPDFGFVVQETYAPYALSVIGLGPDVLVLGEKKRLRAVELWGKCLESGTWPGYPAQVCTAELPPWVEAQWMAREYHEIGEERR